MKPTKIIFVPVEGHRTINGRARAVERTAARQWRRQINDWFATVPSTDSAIVEFFDGTAKTYRPNQLTRKETTK
jgi:hypothetical protein